MKGLGKGFDSLIPTNFDSSLLVDEKDRIQKIALTDVHPNSGQPRKHFEEQALNELADSIKKYGILQPIIVSPEGSGEKYRIVAGERRWRAAGKAGLDKIPAIVRKREELEELEISLIENVQRVDLSPIEQAISIERLHQQFNMSYQAIAERLGKAAATLNNTVRLLQLPKNARDALEAKKITEGHGRAILALKGKPAQQEQLLKEIISKGLSVRQAEQFVQANKEGPADNKKTQAHLSTETLETKNLAKTLGTNVSIRRLAKGGRLEIHFANDEELQSLINTINDIN